jgi:hypothetical protein
LTFCANRLEPSATILMSALPPKAEISTFQLNVRFGSKADIAGRQLWCLLYLQVRHS